MSELSNGSAVECYDNVICYSSAIDKLNFVQENVGENLCWTNHPVPLK